MGNTYSWLEWYDKIFMNCIKQLVDPVSVEAGIRCKKNGDVCGYRGCPDNSTELKVKSIMED